MIEAGAAFLFDLFKDEQHVTSSCSKKIRNFFGPFPATAATKAQSITNTLACSLPDDVLEKLSPENKQQEKSPPEFGKNVKFNVRGPPDEEIDLQWLDSGDEVQPGLDFSMKWENVPSDSVPQSGNIQLDAGWLKRQVGTYYAGDTGLGMSLDDLRSTIFDVLSTSRPDSELQNEASFFSSML